MNKSTNSSNAFETLKKKVVNDEKFKKTKYYVKEVPLKKPKISVNIEEKNKEEDERHKKELDEFFR